METHVNYTLAGLFVIGLLTSVVFGLVWLTAGLNRGEYITYEVLMTESVSGLSVDGPVEFNGVNVGTVSQIKISHADPKLVELFLRIKSDTPISIATRAKLAVRALTGVGYILLEDKGTDKRPLLKKPDQPYPVIETVPSILVRLETTLTQLTNSFKELSHSMQALLDKENLQQVKELLKATKSTFKLLETRTIPMTNQALTAANQTLTSLDATTRELSFIATEVRSNPALLIRGKAPSTKLGPGEK